MTEWVCFTKFTFLREPNPAEEQQEGERGTRTKERRPKTVPGKKRFAATYSGKGGVNSSSERDPLVSGAQKEARED